MAELNLVPFSLKEKRRKKHFFRQYLSLGIVILCILFFGIYFPMGTLSKLNANADSLYLKVASYEDVINERESIKVAIDFFNKYANKVTSLTANKVMVADRIRGLEAYIPKEIIFDNISYNNTLITIQGNSSDFNAISEFSANLQMSQNYSKAEISNISFNKGDNTYTFSLNIDNGVLK